MTVRIRIERDADGGLLEEGTGFVCAGGFVVTACHVLEQLRNGSHATLTYRDGTAERIVDDQVVRGARDLDAAIIMPPPSTRARTRRFDLPLAEVHQGNAFIPVAGTVQGPLSQTGNGNVLLTATQISSAPLRGISGSPVQLQIPPNAAVGVVFRHEVNQFTAVPARRISFLLGIVPESPNRRLRPTLFEFIRENDFAIAGVVGATLFITVIATSLLGLMRHEGIILAQLVFLVIATGMSRHVWRRHRQSSAELRATYASHGFGTFEASRVSELQFGYWWLGLLSAWLALYTSKLVAVLVPGLLTENSWAIWTTFLNNTGTLFMGLAYYVMQFNTVDARDQTDQSASHLHSAVYTPLLGGIAFCIVFFTLHVMCGQLLPGSCWPRAFELASGALAGLTFASWIGKFDSKFIDANPSAVALLYLYAVIQPLWPYLNVSGHDTDPLSTRLSTLLLALSLTFKIVLFVFIGWIVLSNRLLFYFANIRRVYGSVASDWSRLRPLPAAQSSADGGSSVVPDPTLSLTQNVPYRGVVAAIGLVISITALAVFLQESESRPLPTPSLEGAFEGIWEARIEWSRSQAEKLARCREFVFDPKNPSDSQGTIIVQRSSAPALLSVWRFDPTPPWSGEEPGEALLHVSPKVIEEGHGSLVLEMFTTGRMPVPCLTKPASASLAGKYRLALQLPAGSNGDLSGSMESWNKDTSRWEPVGTAALKRKTVEAYYEEATAPHAAP